MATEMKMHLAHSQLLIFSIVNNRNFQFFFRLALMGYFVDCIFLNLTEAYRQAMKAFQVTAIYKAFYLTQQLTKPAL